MKNCVNCERYKVLKDGIGRCLGLAERAKDEPGVRRYQFCREHHWLDVEVVQRPRERMYE